MGNLVVIYQPLLYYQSDEVVPGMNCTLAPFQANKAPPYVPLLDVNVLLPIKSIEFTPATRYKEVMEREG